MPFRRFLTTIAFIQVAALFLLNLEGTAAMIGHPASAPSTRECRTAKPHCCCCSVEKRGACCCCAERAVSPEGGNASSGERILCAAPCGGTDTAVLVLLHLQDEFIRGGFLFTDPPRSIMSFVSPTVLPFAGQYPPPPKPPPKLS